MSFEKLIRIPAARIAVLIGRNGQTKLEIERSCSVKILVDSRSGEVTIKGSGSDITMPFRAAEIVSAIGRGFSPDTAMNLLDEEKSLHVIDLREFAGRSPSHLERIKGRIIGEGGKARRNMENLSGTQISVYGRTVAVIGSISSMRLAIDAISSLSNGSMHGSVYGRLESARRREKSERMVLWEDQNVF